MADTRRPLSPHLSVYRWQVQMVTSILHRATGIALAAGLLLVAWGLIALAGGEEGFGRFTAFVGSPLGIALLVGWSWALFFHLCNGIRHLIQDGGHGYGIAQFVRSSWVSIIASALLTALAWTCVLNLGVAA